jgi:hypothetical protein
MITTVAEGKRGCGWRKAGGIYLMAEGRMAPCDRMPLQVGRCPTCGGGVKPSRGFTWIEPPKLWEHIADFTLESGRFRPCQQEPKQCMECPVGFKMPDRAGLIWVGSKFYQTPADFITEAKTMGVSRRIPSVPKDFVVGETWVYFAHREAVLELCSACNGFKRDKETHEECEVCDGAGMNQFPGIFYACRPNRIEIVVDESCTDEEAEAYEKRGLTPVIIERLPQQKRIDGGSDGPE